MVWTGHEIGRERQMRTAAESRVLAKTTTTAEVRRRRGPKVATSPDANSVSRVLSSLRVFLLEAYFKRARVAGGICLVWGDFTLVLRQVERSFLWLNSARLNLLSLIL